MSEEPTGDCECDGKACKNGFGWIYSDIRDLSGNMHSGRMEIYVCPEYPDNLKVFDESSGNYYPPLPPGIRSLDTLKGFMKDVGEDLQKAHGEFRESERALEAIHRKKKWMPKGMGGEHHHEQHKF